MSTAKLKLVGAEALDGGDSSTLRGDPITGDRYYSKAFMEREWTHMWTKVWHVGARLCELAEPGDYVVHNIGHESFILVRGNDRKIRTFFNVCLHRGNRLVWNMDGSVPAFTCAYHGWQFGLDGSLEDVQDPDNFRGGSPCGKVTLKEVRCESWGGFVWYTMDDGAPSLLDYLDPIPELLKNRNLEDMKRVLWRKVRVRTNWKFASDNFNESYHLPTVHPQMREIIDEDYKNTDFEMYANGHNRMIEQGQPSMRSDYANQLAPLWVDILKAWDLDPKDFENKRAEGRLALQKQKRALGPSKGHHYTKDLTDDELTDYFHHTIFPNVTLTGTPVDGGVHIFRTEPDEDDPNWCTFEYWGLSPKIEGQAEVMSVAGPKSFEEAELEEVTYGVDEVGDFIDQDVGVAVWQQKGLRSAAYEDAILCEQETRIRRFHEVLNDYLEGRR